MTVLSTTRFGKNILVCITIALFILLCFTPSSFAESAPEEQWEKTFGGENMDRSMSVQQTSDEGYIITGFTSSFGAGAWDAWLIKTDSKGNEQWDKTFGGEGDEFSFSVQQTLDGGYAIVGYGDDYLDIYPNGLFIKTDSKGNKQWERTFGEGTLSSLYSIQQTLDGGYVMVGRIDSKESESFDGWLIETDAEGNEEWSRTFGGEEKEELWSVQQTPDEGYIVVGSTYSFGAGEDDVWLIKTDSKGNKQWDRTFGGEKPDMAYSIQCTSDGGYIVVGSTYSFGAGEDDVWLIKTDSKGNEQWDRTFGGEKSDMAYSIQCTSDGGYIIAGRTDSFGAEVYNAWLIKTDSEGNEQWDQTFEEEAGSALSSVKQTSDNGYVLTGSTVFSKKGTSDALLIKLAGNDIYNYTEKGIEKPSERVVPGFEALFATLMLFVAFTGRRRI
jgi:hypothetical protein